MGEIYKLQPKYMIINFNTEMIAAIVTESEDSFLVTGNFRNGSDFAAMVWETEDKYSHKDYSYPAVRDFSGVTLSYRCLLSGCCIPLDDINAPALTIETSMGGIHYVRLWNYVVDRPLDSWEDTSGRFPGGRTPGDADGTKGHIVLDFDNLYAGWNPEAASWTKIPPSSIKSIKWGFIPYVTGSLVSEEFKVSFYDWNVTGNILLRQEGAAKNAHDIMMCDDYDDCCHLTPERLVDEYYALGYRGFVDFYIGASHFYDKTGSGSGHIMQTGYPLNTAYETWYRDYARRLARKGYTVIPSISMELLEPPAPWCQRAWDGTPAQSGWTPPPHFVSFTNPDVKRFYLMNARKHAEISADYGMTPYIQLGEPWWWVQPDTNAPCFYDSSTRDAYADEHDGSSMPVIQKESAPAGEHRELFEWLGSKIGQFTLELRNAVKTTYPDAQFGVLFFPPTVLDPDRASEISRLANCPLDQWKYPNLDYFMIEDYDYLIHCELNKNINTLFFAQDELGYPQDKIHYFSGFVLNASDGIVWEAIAKAINNARNIGTGNIYIWAGSQVRRDGWHPPAYVPEIITRYQRPVSPKQ